jgi:serine/threonine-protein kinase
MDKKTRWLVWAVAAVGLLVLAIVAAVYYFRPTSVPDVRLKTVAQATALLEQAGLALGEASKVATTAVGDGLVSGQTPGPGSRAPQHSAVAVVVAVQPAPASVPSVSGMQADVASETLAAALYLPLQVDLFDTDDPVGSVIGQLPEPDTSWTTGRPVAFGVAAGPDDGTGVKVPDVEGDVLGDAVAAMDDAGLGSYVVVRDVKDAQDNRVVRQLPAAGAVVRLGTTVLIYLELP